MSFKYCVYLKLWSSSSTASSNKKKNNNKRLKTQQGKDITQISLPKNKVFKVENNEEMW